MEATLVCSNSHIDIHSASESGDFEHLQRTSNVGVSIESTVENTETDAALEGTLQIHSNCRTALHTAAVNGNLEELQRMLEDGIAVEYGDIFGTHCTVGAAKRRHKTIIRFLLENGSCTNVPDCDEFTRLAITAKEGHCKIVYEFLDHNPKILPRDAKNLNTQLHKVSESGDLEAFLIILKIFIIVDTINEIGSKPLRVVTDGDKEIRRILLKISARVNAADKNGKTPLILAAEKGGVQLSRELLSATAVENLSSTVFSAATKGHTEVVREMLNHDASMNSTNETGETILRPAAAKGHVEVVTELLNRGTEVDIIDVYCSAHLDATPLMGHLETVRELLKHVSSVDIADEFGRTPPIIGGSEGHEEIV